MFPNAALGSTFSLQIIMCVHLVQLTQDFAPCITCRYLYFLQLKHLILNGDLDCSNDLAVKLASYALQGNVYLTQNCNVYSLMSVL